MGSRVGAAGTEAFDGCYQASRAAALAGVPVSTVYYWARTNVVVPSVSAHRVKLWSYADLMSLRIVYWLRQDKPEASATSMAAVRRALSQLEHLGQDLWEPIQDGDSSPIRVDRQGTIHLLHDDQLARVDGQFVMGGAFDPLSPFQTETMRGPDLVRPRPHLRIVPGKVAGEPHLAGTRVTSLSIAALAERGFKLGAITAMYPDEDPRAIAEALDLEQDLAAAA